MVDVGQKLKVTCMETVTKERGVQYALILGKLAQPLEVGRSLVIQRTDTEIEARRFLRTSLVRKIELDDGKLFVFTRNSKYQIEPVEVLS